jgi:elongation factor Ts
VHAGGKIGVMVEVNCETDFVARTDQFKQLAHDIALQIAATSPKYVSMTDIPAQVLAEQTQTFEDAARAEGKSDAILEKIVKGRLDKYYADVCLLQQPFIRDDSTTIEELVKAAIGVLGENIVVRRFVRYALGE